MVRRRGGVSAVIGAGTMGSGIALVFAKAGYRVAMTDVSEKVLDQARKRIEGSLDTFVKVRLISRTAARDAISRIEFSSDAEEAVGDAEFVTEAVPEELGLKQETFRMLDACAPADAVLATNTSGLDVTAIAKGAKNRSRVIGANWWNPAHIVPLVEVLRGEQTSDDTASRTMEVLERIGKKPVLVRRRVKGFIGNRLQFALFREALSLCERGVADFRDIDTAVRYGLGFRYALLGPFAVADFGGLDVFRHISEELNPDLDASAGVSPALSGRVKEGKLGLKSGEGFYSYRDRSPAEFLRRRDDGLLRLLAALQAEGEE